MTRYAYYILTILIFSISFAVVAEDVETVDDSVDCPESKTPEEKLSAITNPRTCYQYRR